MGADLYIEVLHDKHREKCIPAFNRAVARRDAHRKKHECQLRFDRGMNPDSPCPQMNKLQQAVKKASTKLWDEDPGYYRDSYNNSNLLWRLEYKGEGPTSYWRDIKTDRNGNMSVRRAKAWLEAVKEATIRPIGKAESDAAGDWSSSLTDEQKAEWNDYFAKKKVKLEAFLQRAVDLKQPIRCSC